MDKFYQENRNLVKEIERDGIKDKKVLNAILEVPRHLFVSEYSLNEAYGNYPLPINAGQTISQPYTVAFMIEALELKKGDKVLEVGAGSGWNAAIIGKIVGNKGKVIATEIISELAISAKENIKKVGLKNIKIICWDGSQGYEKEKPYDRIIVTAACPKIPAPLLEQLKVNGILVAPIGPFFSQRMIRVIKTKKKVIKDNLGNFVFVPLRGKYGF